MWSIEGSWGGSVDVLEDIWQLDGDRRVVTERGARRLADATRVARRSRCCSKGRELDFQPLGAPRFTYTWNYEFDPELEANTLAEIAEEKLESMYLLRQHVEDDFSEGYLRFLVTRGATSLHVALVSRLLARLSRELAPRGWQVDLSRLLTSLQAELVVAIRARTVTAELGTRMVKFLLQFKAWSRLQVEMDFDEASWELVELEEAAFDPALSMTRLDADLLQAALLAASRIDLDARTAIAALFVLEIGMTSSGLSSLAENQLDIWEGGSRLLDQWGRPICELSGELFVLASMLTERNRALGNFSGWLSEGLTLFQARESVRSRGLAPSWFTDSLRKMSRDLWRAGLSIGVEI